MQVTTTALGRPPFTSRQFVDMDTEGSQSRAGGRRVALAGLRSAALVILNFLGNLVNQGCSESTEMPHARHHGHHGPVNLTHGQLWIFPPEGPGEPWRGKDD